MDVEVPLGRPQWSQGLVSCGAMQVHSPLQPEKQCQPSCLVDHRDQCLSLEAPQGCHTCNRVLSLGDRRVIAGKSGASGVHWDIGDLLKWWHDPWSCSRASSGDRPLLRCDRNAGIPSPTKHGQGPSSRDEDGEPGLFLSCGRT